MATRNEPIKTLALTVPTFNRLIRYKLYHESNEGVILKLLDIADKYNALLNPPRTKYGKFKKRS